MAIMTNEFDAEFDQTHVDDYIRQRPKFEALAAAIEQILKRALQRRNIKIAFTQSRAKEIESFRRKISEVSKDDSNKPKYADPLNDISDLAGVRVITLVASVIQEVDELIREEFDILERIDKGEETYKDGHLGYTSVHYRIAFTAQRLALPEYADFEGMKAEIQVRTIVQHTWAEIEHDILYKATGHPPAVIQRRFSALAGALDLVERELQSLVDEDRNLRQNALQSVESGNLKKVEITADTLKAYLDKRLEEDGRISFWSYESAATELEQLGFRYIEDIDSCIEGYDSEELSKLVWGTKKGSLTRLNIMLLAGMGEDYINQHPLHSQAAFRIKNEKALQKLRDAGVPIRSNHD